MSAVPVEFAAALSAAIEAGAAKIVRARDDTFRVRTSGYNRYEDALYSAALEELKVAVPARPEENEADVDQILAAVGRIEFVLKNSPEIGKLGATVIREALDAIRAEFPDPPDEEVELSR